MNGLPDRAVVGVPAEHGRLGRREYPPAGRKRREPCSDRTRRRHPDSHGILALPGRARVEASKEACLAALDHRLMQNRARVEPQLVSLRNHPVQGHSLPPFFDGSSSGKNSLDLRTNSQTLGPLTGAVFGSSSIFANSRPM
jgi:hypothetical protein